ncbi:sigma 54-interacting transcriptional regulator [Immundisolibacter sp.]|uniref:sigma 54-interacting transcriptional regulator n=1 Tax=Immundisolibacter sp. TaxID=1934948 RepID=UPI00261D002E|nr:sigma 54-interacting transcriptional regulator [Immundisolibacter sp.]MDD3650055.1 sigma 54-interacting transcriptional regulator [Immundisolibacter sp.]
MPGSLGSGPGGGARPSATVVGRPPAGTAHDHGDPIHRRLAFNQAEAAIRFDGFRMMLVYSTLLARLKQELINHCGYARARGAVQRLGYAEGTKTVLLAGERGQGTDFASLMAVAGEVWSLTGNAKMSVVSADIRPDASAFRVELELHHSIEAHAHLEVFGGSSEPMCWLQTGATSGLCSAFAGRAVVVRELECVAMGHARCLLVGQSPEAWGQMTDQTVEETGFHLRPDELVNRFSILKAQRGRQAAEPPTDVVGVSASFVAALEQLRKVAPTRATVLLQGETGTGKEVFANLLHRMSRRAAAPFVAVNCAALPDSLAEAELFGVERGAYTGATQARPGRFERASTGTLFLDEVGTLSSAIQAKLLRVLQVGQVERLGGISRQVDVRVVAATNDDLWQKVVAGGFREDLYFRLATFPIVIPPLRQRRDDIPLLIEHFLHHYGELHGRVLAGLSGRAVQALLHYDYPGNVRELEHVIERAVIRANDGESIDLAHLGLPAHAPLLQLDAVGRLQGGQPAPLPGRDVIGPLLDRGMSLDGVEQALLSGALDKAGGNRSQAARSLGLTRRQFNYRYHKSGLAGR